MAALAEFLLQPGPQAPAGDPEANDSHNAQKGRRRHHTDSAIEQKLASAPPSACAPLVRRLVQRKRMFLRLPAPPRGR